MCGPCNIHTNVGVKIVMSLGGREFPLCGKFIEEQFGFATKESNNRYHKWGEVFSLAQIGKEVFLLILLILCLQHISEGAVYTIFFICVHNYDINYGVSLELPQMADLKIPSEALHMI